MFRLRMIAGILAVVAFAFAMGTWYGAGSKAGASTARRILYYTCPMHPQYRSDKPGDAPCCGMRLVPVYEGESGPAAAEGGTDYPAGTVHINTEKQQLLGIQTIEAAVRPFASVIRTTGRVLADENRIYRLNTSTDLWIRKVYPPTTGSIVEKDEPLLEFYTTSFLTSASAYMYALNTRDRQLKEGGTNEAQLSTLNYQIRQSIEGLQNIGVSDVDIAEMERTRQPKSLVPLRSPSNGLVLSRNASVGQWVGPATELYQIADLSRVWVLADLFLEEARHVRPGAKAKVTLRERRMTMPAEVTAAPPLFDATSRTIQVRLEMDNPGLMLRPEMFVDVEFPVALPAGLIVPAGAILNSGTRNVAYVDRGNGVFEPRDVEVAWRFGDAAGISNGLSAGEHVVVAGNFLLDSESRMRLAAQTIPQQQKQKQEAKAKDPVCGMTVDPATAKKAEYRGKTYYFCSEECKRRFEQEPGKYIEKK
jgi:Cu(I)/Ag(I) efflux system membrane fusion protein